MNISVILLSSGTTISTRFIYISTNLKNLFKDIHTRIYWNALGQWWATFRPLQAETEM